MENLNLDQVSQDMMKFYKTMDLPTRMKVQSSWDNLRKKLESLPAISDSFEKMDFSDFSKQKYKEVVVPDNFSHLVDVEEIPELLGEKFPEELVEADFQSECAPGLDVALFTLDKKKRPYVGRVESRASDDSFYISWYEKRPRSKTYIRCNLPLDEIEDQSVMIWGFSCNRTETSFDIDSVYKLKIDKLYEEHDRMMNDD